MELKVYRKILLIDPLRGLIHQGENLSERIVIVMDKMYENLDRSELTWAIREFTEKETIAEQTMSKVTDGDKVHLLWEVTSDFTAADGPVSIELRGTRGGGEVISVIAASDKLIIWPDVNQPYPPAPPLSEQVLAEVHETAEQAKQIVNAGINFKILGVYDTLENLQAEKPNPNVGDAYGVGIDPNIYVYVWDGAEWDKGQKLGGGGGAPVDTYTKAESDERYPLKTNVEADFADRYTKEEIDNKLMNIASLTAAGDETIAVTCNGVTTQLGVANLDVGTEFVVGKDYTVYKQADGSYAISLDTNKPDVQKIGGFHYGTCRRVNAQLQPINTAGAVNGSGWESNVYNGILPRSVWDQNHRPSCDPRGMVYLGTGVWVDIYLSSDDGMGGLQSAYNATPLTGSDGLNWYGFAERAKTVGKRLLNYEEFCTMASGSPEGLDDSNINAWTSSTNSGLQKTGYVRNAVSSIGCRDAVGNVWEWLDEFVTRAEHSKLTGSGTFPSYDGGRGGKSYTDGNGHYHASNDGAWSWDKVSPYGDGYGNIFQYNDYSLIALVGGGAWYYGINAGARAVSLSNSPWHTHGNTGARCACNDIGGGLVTSANTDNASFLGGHPPEYYAVRTNVYTKSETDMKTAEKASLVASGDTSLSVSWNGRTTQLGAENLDTGSEFVVGKDYTVYRLNDSYAISLDADKTGAQKIGGFHYGACRRVDEKLRPVNLAGEVRGEGWESNVYNGILPRSVWYKGHRPACDPKGMVYLGNGTWVDIYQSSDDGDGGLLSAYNQLPLTGTEGLNWYGFVERALVVGKRLLTYREFCQMAYGSPQGLDDSNENAWTAKTNSGRQKTGYVANAVSSIGCRDAVGNAWEWLDDNVVRAEHSKISGTGTFSQYDGGRANQTYTNGNGHSHATNNGAWGWDTISPFGAGYGNVYEYNDFSLTTLMGGGCRFDGAGAGARTVNLSYYPWIIRSHVGARCACNSF